MRIREGGGGVAGKHRAVNNAWHFGHFTYCNFLGVSFFSFSFLQLQQLVLAICPTSAPLWFHKVTTSQHLLDLQIAIMGYLCIGRGIQSNLAIRID